MGKIFLVDPKTKRHKENAKYLLEDVCNTIEDLEYKVAGYAVFSWDDRGRTAFAYQAGGPISSGAMSSHISEKITESLRTIIKRSE